ncbi:MAG: helix-turn-helix transcriptional regulator [Gaiellaceae bacterium]
MTEIETLREALPTAAGTSAIEPVTPERPTMASISKEAAYLRDRNEILGTEVKELHHETVLRTLDERAAVLGMQDPGEILEAVGAEHGLSWSSVARMIGVTPTAIRKWRRGEPITPQNRQRLSLLLAFLELLKSPFPVADPGSWLDMPLSSEATVSPADLYAAGRRDLLVDFASRRQGAHAILDAYDPDWRARHLVDDRFEVVPAPDGELSLVEKPRER